MAAPWLESVHEGYGRFAGAFDEYGVESKDDLRALDADDKATIFESLTASGAKPLNLKKISQALESLSVADPPSAAAAAAAASTMPPPPVDPAPASSNPSSSSVSPPAPEPPVPAPAPAPRRCDLPPPPPPTTVLIPDGDGAFDLDDAVDGSDGDGEDDDAAGDGGGRRIGRGAGSAALAEAVARWADETPGWLDDDVSPAIASDEPLLLAVARVLAVLEVRVGSDGSKKAVVDTICVRMCTLPFAPNPAASGSRASSVTGLVPTSASPPCRGIKEESH